MLELKDFIHLPALDPLIGKLLADNRGLTVIAGLDPRPEISEAAGVPGSGRTTIFRILVRQLLENQPGLRALVVTAERGSLRLSRQLRRRVEEHVVHSAAEMAETVGAIAAVSDGGQAALLVIDHLDGANVAPALAAARAGRHILAQLETVSRGAAVARLLLELGATPADLDGLHWVLAVQRLPALCTQCRAAVAPAGEELALLGRRWMEPLPGPFYRAAGCDSCQGSGRQDTIAAFDLYCRQEAGDSLPLEAYLGHLAQEGHVSLDDLLYVEADETRRSYALFAASERELLELRASMQARLAELESAYRVAQQRTEALVSLQEVGDALATTGDLRALAHQICVQACDLSGGDYALLYMRHEGDEAEVLASHGWDLGRIESPIQLGLDRYQERSLDELPPGIGPLRPGVRAANIRGGVFLPLLKQGEPIGALVVQSGRKARFEPGEVSLLRGLAALAVVT
ncbi:MAG: GAF domain-containing protein, partial [Anaerolineae bacterium]|nr:GAF domain-containing protein [Anaerolineae bacterium]